MQELHATIFTLILFSFKHTALQMRELGYSCITIENIFEIGGISNHLPPALTYF
jgi:hypothetical protein